MEIKDIKKYFHKRTLDNGFVRVNIKPHTKPIESLPSCCNGVTTANYYFLCKYFGVEIDGLLTIREIQKLQELDAASPKFGCMRWYREEPFISDTNGAFFVLKPICLAMRLCKDAISLEEQKIILEMLDTAGNWFAKECEEPELYYPNKTVSDGAILLLIGNLLQDNQRIAQARAFWQNWIAYTENYGWGWGENTSRGYTSIIIDALNIALNCLQPCDELYKKLYKIRSEIIDYVAYHEEFEFIPSIRTYNFEGHVKDESRLNLIHPKEAQFQTENYQLFASYILHCHTTTYIPNPDPKNFHQERIFEDSVASTFKGKNLHLGTVSHFPVMPGCYQGGGTAFGWQTLPKCHQVAGWGLGWQSMPVSVLVKNHSIAFLRFCTLSGGRLRTHPAYNHHDAYLDNKLFMGENIPYVNTYSKQQGNVAVVVRDVRQIANTISYFADEWFLPRFLGKIRQYKQWYVFEYEECLFAVSAINGKAEIRQEGENWKLVQVCYEGEEKEFALKEWIALWCVVALDTTQDWQAQLDEKEVVYTEKRDYKFPRNYQPFRIACGDVHLDFDTLAAKVY